MLSSPTWRGAPRFKDPRYNTHLNLNDLKLEIPPTMQSTTIKTQNRLVTGLRPTKVLTNRKVRDNAKKLGFLTESDSSIEEDWDKVATSLILQLKYAFENLKTKQAKLTPKLTRDILDLRPKITSVLRVCPSFYGESLRVTASKKQRAAYIKASREMKRALTLDSLESDFDNVKLEAQSGIFSGFQKMATGMSALADASETLIPNVNKLAEALDLASINWTPEQTVALSQLPAQIKAISEAATSAVGFAYNVTFVTSVVAAVAALLMYSGSKKLSHLMIAGLSGAFALATCPAGFKAQIFGWVTSLVTAVTGANKPEAQFGLDSIKDLAFAGVALLTGLRAKFSPTTAIQACWDYFSKHALLVTSFTATITAVLKCAEWICNKFALVLGSERVFHFLESSSADIDEWSVKVDKIWRQIALKTYSFTMTTFEQVTQLCVEGSEILKKLPRSPESVALSHFVSQKQRRLEEIHKLFAQSNFVGSGTRQEPVTIVLQGLPGSGKTIMATYLHTILCARCLPLDQLEEFKKAPSSFMYNRQSESDFHDGYQTKNFTTLLDDFMQIKDVAGKPDSEAMGFIRMKNSFPMHLHMASMESKANTFFQSKFLIATTNDMSFDVESIISKEAILRRMDLVYKIDFNPEYCKKQGNGLVWDKDKLPRDENGKTIFVPELCRISRVTRHFSDGTVPGDKDEEILTPCSFDELVEASVAQFDMESARFQQRTSMLEALASNVVARRLAQDNKVYKSLRLSDFYPWGIPPTDKYWDQYSFPKDYPAWLVRFDEMLEEELHRGRNKSLVERLKEALSEHYLCDMLVTHTLSCVAYAIYRCDNDFSKWKDLSQWDDLIMEVRDSGEEIVLPIVVPDLPERLEAPEGRKLVSRMLDTLKPEKGSLYSTLLKVGAGVAITSVLWVVGEKMFAALDKAKEDVIDAERELSLLKSKVAMDHSTTVTLPSDTPGEYVRVKTDPDIHYNHFKKDYEPSVSLQGYHIPMWFYNLKHLIRTATNPEDEDDSLNLPRDLWTGNDVLDSIAANAHLHAIQKGIQFSEDYFAKYLNSYDFDEYMDKQSVSPSLITIFIKDLYNKWTRVTSWFSVQKDLPEAQSFGHSDRMRIKIAAAREKLCGKPIAKTVSLPEAQMGMPHGSNAQAKVNAVIRRNTYEFLVETVDDEWDRCGFVTFVAGKVAILPAHYVTALLSQIVVDPSQVFKRIRLVKCKAGLQLPERLRVFECQKGEMLAGYNSHIPAFTQRDLALVRFDSFPKDHSHIVKYWGTQKDIDEIRDWNFSLEMPFNDNPKKIQGSAKYFSRAQSIEFQFGLGEIVQGFRYTGATTKGDCGALFTLLTNSNTRGVIYGLHSAALVEDAICFASCVSREELQEWLSTYIIDCEDDIDNPISVIGTPLLEPQMLIRTPFMVMEERPVDTALYEGPSPLGIDSFSLVPSRFDIVGVSPLSSYASGKSRLLRSPLYGAWGPATTRPCHLRPFVNEEGERVDPYQLALNKYGTPYLVVPEDMLSLARRGMLQWMRQVMPRNYKIPVFTFREAVAGHQAYPEFGSMNRKSSMGYPYTLMKEFNGGRKKMWGADGDFDFTTPQSLILEKSVEHIIRDAKQGYRGLHVFIDCLKDERRPREKVEAGKTRMFSAGPLDLLIAMRMYYAPFVIAYVANRIDNGSAVGMNPYSYEWQQMVDHVCSVADPRDHAFGAGDQSAMDANERAQVIKVLGGIIEDYLEGSPDERAIRSILLMEHYNSKHLVGNTVYEMDSGIPSGSFMTMVMNCLYNQFGLRYAWLFNHGATEEENGNFDKNVRSMIQGDDNFYSVSHKYRETFTEACVADGMAAMGLIYTSDDKGLPRNRLRPLSEITFLKRKMVWDPVLLRHLAPLELPVVLEIPYWTKKKANMQTEITKTNAQLSLDELALHGKEVFDKHAPLMRTACQERLQWVPARTEYETCKSFILGAELIY